MVGRETESLVYQWQCLEENSEVISSRVQNSKRMMEFLNSALMGRHRREIKSSLPRRLGENGGKKDPIHLVIHENRAVHRSQNAILNVGGALWADPGENRDLRILGSPKYMFLPDVTPKGRAISRHYRAEPMCTKLSWGHDGSMCYEQQALMRSRDSRSKISYAT